MRRWELQLRVYSPPGEPERWEGVHAVGSPPYRFLTRDDAEGARRLCYPEHLERTRTVPVSDGVLRAEGLL